MGGIRVHLLVFYFRGHTHIYLFSSKKSGGIITEMGGEGGEDRH